MGLHPAPDKGLHFHADFERLFKDLWASNGDNISICYTGTRALKGDITRTGNRSAKGALNDLSSSVTRMYINTFRDGFRQICIDYLLGKCGVEAFFSVVRNGGGAGGAGGVEVELEMEDTGVSIPEEPVPS